YVKGCVAQWENQQLIVAASLPCPVFRLQLVGGSLSSPLSRVCVWTALLLFVLPIFNDCTIINGFTRISSEIFGMLIAVLFIQESIKEMVIEFKLPKVEDSNLEKSQFQWIYTNGLLESYLVLAFSVLLLKEHKGKIMV
ncbi:hypothetical protein UlMin_025156, partial [Ulmus minor]